MKRIIVPAIAVLASLAVFAADREREQKVSGLAVELREHPTGKSIYNRNPVIVRFTNTTNNPISILRPLDGSLWCWHMPHYKLEVEDKKGKKLKLSGRCGNSGLWANRKWPGDYVVKLFPNESFEKEIGIYHRVEENGEYKLTFSYSYFANKTNLPNVKYPNGLWQGTATSKPITLKLKKGL